MAHQHLDVVLDSSMTLQTDPTTYTATGQNAAVVDLGSGVRELDVVFNWTACAVAAGDGITFRIQGSNDSTFATGVHVLGTLVLAAERSDPRPLPQPRLPERDGFGAAVAGSVRASELDSCRCGQRDHGALRYLLHEGLTWRTNATTERSTPPCS
jgi:hypothetical protein